jgi:hypothetical protein
MPTLGTRCHRRDLEPASRACLSTSRARGGKEIADPRSDRFNELRASLSDSIGVERSKLHPRDEPCHRIHIEADSVPPEQRTLD